MDRPHWADSIIAIFTALIFLTYITSDYFLWRQLKLTKQTFEEVKKGGTDTHELAVQAAVIEHFHFPTVEIDMPIPEARFNLINRGHFVAHDIHLKFSIYVRNANGKLISTILSKEEIIPEMPPSRMSPNGEIAGPDFIYNFEISPARREQIHNLLSYISVEGIVDYDNGLGTRFKQSFCGAYVWGPSPKIGRMTGACENAQAFIHDAKRYQ